MSIPRGGSVQRPRPGPAASAGSAPAARDSARARSLSRAVATAAVLLWLAAACTSVPYQEMSDARQALESAHLAVDDMPGPRAMVLRAETLLDRARMHLRDRQYDDARRLAKQAKSLAIEARERAER